MPKTKVVTLTIDVTVPATTGENEIEEALNAALDEPPCDWEEWTVGRLKITEVKARGRMKL